MTIIEDQGLCISQNQKTDYTNSAFNLNS